MSKKIELSTLNEGAYEAEIAVTKDQCASGVHGFRAALLINFDDRTVSTWYAYGNSIPISVFDGRACLVGNILGMNEFDLSEFVDDNQQLFAALFDAADRDARDEARDRIHNDIFDLHTNT